MVGADIITGWVSLGRVTLLDQYAADHTQPINDKPLGAGGKNDLTSVSGYESQGWTTLSFKRAWDTGDRWDFVFRNTTQFLLIALGAADGSAQATDSSTTGLYTSHYYRQAIPINFFIPFVPAPVTASDAQGILIDPGLVVLISVAILSFIYAVVHWGKIFLKGRASHTYTPRPSVSASANLSLTERATLTEYDILRLQYAYGLSSQDVKPVPSARILFLRGVATYRIPYLDVSVAWATLISLYVLGNFLAMAFPFNGMDYATNFGYLSGANACLLLIPATRNSLISFLFGIPFDRHVSLHRCLALFAVFLVALHTFLFWAKWQKDPDASISLTWTNRKYLYGFIGFFGGIMLVLTSLPCLRRGYFNFFMYNHYLWALIFYLFAMMHTPVKFLPKLAIIVILYGLDKLIRAVYATFPTRAKRVKVNDDMVTLSFPKNKFAEWMKLYSVSQYVFVNFPQISLFEWHPFSLSSGPQERLCEINVRSLGDHTTKLLELAKRKQSADSTLWMRVDGPYGNYGVDFNRYPVKIFFAGGIGITPIISVLRGIYGIGRDGAQACWTPQQMRKGSSGVASMTTASLPIMETSLGGESSTDDPPVPLRVRDSHLIEKRMPSVLFDAYPTNGTMQDVYVLWAISKEEHYKWFSDIFDKIGLLEYDFSLPRMHLLVFLSDRSNAPDTLQSPIVKGSLRLELKDT